MFSGTKVSYMYDQVKQTIRKFNFDHLIIDTGMNGLNRSKTASQVLGEIIDFAKSLLSEMNTVTNHIPQCPANRQSE